MLLFCPDCGTHLALEEGASSFRFVCRTCPYKCNVKRAVKSRKYPKLKEVDEVLSDASSWENVESTGMLCTSANSCRLIYVACRREMSKVRTPTCVLHADADAVGRRADDHVLPML